MTRNHCGVESTEQVSVLVIRAWRHGNGFVAKVIRTTDIEDSAAERIVIASDRETLHAVLDQWLAAGGLGSPS
jgi:hypothetical protein